MASGRRAVRVANCSGFRNDPGYQMLAQVTLGDVDFVTGDYLAEMNIAENAEAFRKGKHDGWEVTAWEGLSMSIDALAERKTKAVINGGSLNPAGLAKKVHGLVQERKLGLKVAYVSGDDLYDALQQDFSMLPHLDSVNEQIQLVQPKQGLTKESMVSANAYLGARGIVAALRGEADIVICGRVADASPVIAAAWYWHDWSDTDYDRLAGALVSGHLIECSAYATGGNFAGFTEYDLDIFVDPGFPIAEINADGTCVITKHSGTSGIVNEDTIRCQFLYELQGNIYLNSDVKAYLDDVSVKQVDQDRVYVSGIRGAPPPDTTKAAIFYYGGYQSQLLVNATGYGTEKKWLLLEKQLRAKLEKEPAAKEISTLEFQIIGVPDANPRSQLKSTTYCRIFAEASQPGPLIALLTAWKSISLQHFSGYHLSADQRSAIPKPFLAYHPGLVAQNKLVEKAVIYADAGATPKTIDAGHPPQYEALERRATYDSASPINIGGLGPTTKVRLGDIVLARSGDKGSNMNCGLFVRDPQLWDWFRTYLSRKRFIELLADDWKNEYHLERVEFVNIYAVHFVIYGILGRGVSGSTLLDSLGKGFADYFRDKLIDVPQPLLRSSKASDSRL